MSQRSQQRSDYRHFQVIPTRWMDNDIYGHVNNVHYYSYFDTAVNQFLIERGVLDIHHGEVVGFVVDTACSYFRPLAFPDQVHAGIRVARIGNTSVQYEVGLFRNDDVQIAAAGRFTHVYVERASGKPVPVPDAVRAVLAPLLVQPPTTA
ncbi:MAG: thioesterase family protein [Burkholderiaceae bacterium]|nr:acyl-CoA thioesterase [Rhodoferax sp.]MCW5641422.1 acyl-CoA thioesterase [Rhodoferax sp.]